MKINIVFFYFCIFFDLFVFQTTESLLGQVEQEPAKAVEDAILPSVTAFISDQLFRHSNMDVKVSVLACITELVRISAPQAPYTDEQMKVGPHH